MKLAVKTLLGLAFGGLLLWLAISQVDLSNAKSALAKADFRAMAVAMVGYWMAVAIRISRWRLLLSETKPLTYTEVGRSLIVGYTMNNLLPARLGELFRVDFVKREYGVARSAVLGSVIVERLADAIAVMALFSFGLAFATFKADASALMLAGLGAALGIAVIIGGLWVVVFWRERLLRDRLRWLSERLEILSRSITTLGPRRIVAVGALTAVIWTFELIAYASVMLGFGVAVDLAGLGLICGAAAFSTLLPSAPGYVGSLQAAFVLAFSALGLEPVLGLLSATTSQILRLGSMTVFGLFLLFTSHLRGATSLLSGGERRDRQ
jgi:glycosyltransferase 2 family protein